MSHQCLVIWGCDNHIIHWGCSAWKYGRCVVRVSNVNWCRIPVYKFDADTVWILHLWFWTLRQNLCSRGARRLLIWTRKKHIALGFPDRLNRFALMLQMSCTRFLWQHDRIGTGQVYSKTYNTWSVVRCDAGKTMQDVGEHLVATRSVLPPREVNCSAS